MSCHIISGGMTQYHISLYNIHSYQIVRCPRSREGPERASRFEVIYLSMYLSTLPSIYLSVYLRSLSRQYICIHPCLCLLRYSLLFVSFACPFIRLCICSSCLCPNMFAYLNPFLHLISSLPHVKSYANTKCISDEDGDGAGSDDCRLL